MGGAKPRKYGICQIGFHFSKKSHIKTRNITQKMAGEEQSDNNVSVPLITRKINNTIIYNFIGFRSNIRIQ